jgi:NitT/TauT family transport system substrate-binding protein
MKRIVSLLLALMMVLAFAACGGETAKPETNQGNPETGSTQTPPVDDVTVRVAVLSGSTGIGMAKLMDDIATNKASGNYKVDIIAEPNEVVAGVKAGKYDVAALPVNVAAKLYKMTEGNVQVAALNTLGVLHILENGSNTIASIKDLKGKTVYTTGEGATPQYILEYLLQKNGLEVGKDVTVVYEATADGVVAAMTNGTATVCMLPEPKVTAVTKQIKTVNRVLDITAEWEKVCDTDVVQGCVIVSSEFAKQHSAALTQFLAEYKASVEFIAKNPDEGSLLVEKAGLIAKAAIAKEAIPGCNLVYIDGAQMKTTLSAFLTILYDANPVSVGGALPDDAFYYQK